MQLIVRLYVALLFLTVPELAHAIDPGLEISEKWRLSIQTFGLEKNSEQIQEMAESFAFESVKARPGRDGQTMTELLPGEKLSGRERLKVVIVLGSDCSFPFWEDICQNIRGAEAVRIPGERLPTLVIRDVPKMTSSDRAESLVRAMFILIEETPDFQIPIGATEKEAAILERNAKRKLADELLMSLEDQAE